MLYNSKYHSFCTYFYLSRLLAIPLFRFLNTKFFQEYIFCIFCGFYSDTSHHPRLNYDQFNFKPENLYLFYEKIFCTFKIVVHSLKPHIKKARGSSWFLLIHCLTIMFYYCVLFALNIFTKFFFRVIKSNIWYVKSHFFSKRKWQKNDPRVSFRRLRCDAFFFATKLNKRLYHQHWCEHKFIL